MAWVFIMALLIASIATQAQKHTTRHKHNIRLDSLYIGETQDITGPDKVLHAEPLYIDLIRDLGARKGEQEWNVGLGLTDNMQYDQYTALVEYEFAPVHRLGLEVELPFSVYYRSARGVEAPSNRLNSIKLAAQYSFFVSEKLKTSLAVGYINELELVPFNQYGTSRFLQGNIYNPFLIAAKRWGQNWHTLIYAGPWIGHHFAGRSVHVRYQINSNFHYMIKGTRHFVGVEFNKDVRRNDFDMTIRPQMRVAITQRLMVGIVTGIPIRRENERFSSFLRIIYEPSHRQKKSV